MESIKEVAKSYGIYPLKIENMTDDLFRIDDGQQVYALKRSSLSKERIEHWENVFHQAYSQNLSVVLPVYLTKQGSLYIEKNKTFFYLTPWIKEKEQLSIERFYRSIGNLHAKTKQSISSQREKVIQPFYTYKKDCEDTQKRLLNNVLQFEKNIYMSPIELQVCTHYRDLEFAIKKVIQRTEQLIDEQDGFWNICLCHGDLKFSHMLEAGSTYIINWEKAHHENAIMDLATFFKNEVKTNDAPTKSFMEHFASYMNENELNKNELYLLTIYLLDPTEYMILVQQYIEKSSPHTIINQVKLLQQAYRRLIFGLQWSDFIEKEYEMTSLEDLES